jgi:hypothetical protein
MSSRSKSSHLLATGLVAVATIGMLVYFSSSTTTATAKPKKDVDPVETVEDEDAGVVKKPTPSTTSSEGKKSDKTPKKSNVTDQKELHSKIEELDKKGKAQFKNKKVSFCSASAFFFMMRAVSRTGTHRTV